MVLSRSICRGKATNSTSLCLSKEKLQEKRHSGGEDFDFSCPGRKQVCSPLWLQTCPRHVCLTRRALLRTTLIKTTQRGAAAPLWILPGERILKAPLPKGGIATRGKRATFQACCHTSAVKCDWGIQNLEAQQIYQATLSLRPRRQACSATSL